jgi:hypothetical protein
MPFRRQSGTNVPDEDCFLFLTHEVALNKLPTIASTVFFALASTSALTQSGGSGGGGSSAGGGAAGGAADR